MSVKSHFIGEHVECNVNKALVNVNYCNSLTHKLNEHTLSRICQQVNKHYFPFSCLSKSDVDLKLSLVS